MQTIYCDTCIWNAIFKQELGAGELDETPIRNLVISRHVIFEVGQTFEKNAEAGRSFFSSLTRLFDSGLRIVNEPFNLMIEEMNFLRDRRLIDFEWHNRRDFRAELVNLADGNTKTLEAYIAAKCADRDRDRSTIAESLKLDGGLAEELRTVWSEDLHHWIDGQLNSVNSRQRLLKKLQVTFPEVATAELAKWSNAMVRDKRLKVTQALLRLDLYYNWRAARSSDGVAKKDLFPDSYHVINALYCSAYATAEASQSRYCGLLGMSSEKFKCWDRSTRIDRWLSQLVRTLESH